MHSRAATPPALLCPEQDTSPKPRSKLKLQELQISLGLESLSNVQPNTDVPNGVCLTPGTHTPFPEVKRRKDLGLRYQVPKGEPGKAQNRAKIPPKAVIERLISDLRCLGFHAAEAFVRQHDPTVVREIVDEVSEPHIGLRFGVDGIGESYHSRVLKSGIKSAGYIRWLVGQVEAAS